MIWGPMTNTNTGTENRSYARYRFDPSLIEQQGRSVEVILAERLCDSARTKLKEDGSLPLLSFTELRKIFREQCADQDGYLAPHQPVIETVLRLLVSSKTDSLQLEDILERLLELWATSPWPRHITIETLERVVDGAALHGIVRAS